MQLVFSVVQYPHDGRVGPNGDCINVVGHQRVEIQACVTAAGGGGVPRHRDRIGPGGPQAVCDAHLDLPVAVVGGAEAQRSAGNGDRLRLHHFGPGGAVVAAGVDAVPGDRRAAVAPGCARGALGPTDADLTRLVARRVARGGDVLRVGGEGNRVDEGGICPCAHAVRVDGLHGDQHLPVVWHAHPARSGRAACAGDAMGACAIRAAGDVSPGAVPAHADVPPIDLDVVAGGPCYMTPLSIDHAVAAVSHQVGRRVRRVGLRVCLR